MDYTMSSPPTSPSRRSDRSGSTSPARRRPRNNSHRTSVPPGFLVHKPKQTPISEMPVWELQNKFNRNAKILASSPSSSTRTPSSPSSSSYIQRLTAEQAAIQEQLVEVHGMEFINTGLGNTRISDEISDRIGDNDQDVEIKEEDLSESRTKTYHATRNPMKNAIDAKKRALAKFGATAGPSHIGMLGMEEAIAIEQRAHVHDLERKQRMEEKRLHHGYPKQNEVMSREEREARIWAFMNYKPTDSDLEDDDDDLNDDGENDSDPAGWFEDDQDDGRKGQNIVEPDEEDPESLSNIIRVMDPNQMRYGTFYEPRDDGD